MYVICFERDGENVWELVDGEDAMLIRVDELISELGCDEEDIMVFEHDAQM